MAVHLNSNLDQDSLDMQDSACRMRAEAKQKAIEIIQNSLPNAALRVLELSDTPEDISEGVARASAIRFKAASHLLKLGGLEQENINHSGKLEFVPVRYSQDPKELEVDNEKSGS